jgi:dTDP-4-dehydrorhamnose reductase
VKVLVTGAGGMLAHAVRTTFALRGHDVLALDRAALDVTDAAAVRAAILDARPDAVVQCAGWTRVDDAEQHEAEAQRVNGAGAGFAADACSAIGARFVYPSTDYVFDGCATTPYPPDAPTAPVNAYGRTKLAGETESRDADTLIVRTSWLYGPSGRSFVSSIVERARQGLQLRVVDDQHGAPTSTQDLAGVIITLLEQRAPAGVYHATNGGHTTWFGLARAALELAGVDAVLEPCTSAEFPTPARRPAWSVLDCSATHEIVGAIPHWRDALAASIDEVVA